MSSRKPVPAPNTPVAQRIALLGNPNTGKTTVFNRLCGARAKTSNFPGTTTTTRTGLTALPGDRRVEVVDLPGLYQVHLEWPESRIAQEVLEGRGHGRTPDAFVAIVDASNLARNLVLVGELLAYGRPLVIGLNMLDVAERRGLRVNATALATRLGVPVVPLVASRATGMDELRQAISYVLGLGTAPPRPADLPADASGDAMATWAEDVTRAVGGEGTSGHADRFSDRVDRVLTHPLWGTLVFLVVMGSLFWTLFALARLPMDLIDATFKGLGDMAGPYIPEGPLQGLVSRGIIGGVAGTVVFLPQIMLLFFLISLLEDTGYLARAAFVNDRIFSRFGLPGQAFVPLLTAHACALPGIMSTRLIPNRRDRLATILVLPFMSCSARLPVYVLLTSLLFANNSALAGLSFAGCYVLGAAAAFLTAALFGKTILKGRARPMMLELPTYKWPSLLNAALHAKDQGVNFLKTAGTIIFAICVVMWWLSAYPRVQPPEAAVALRAQAVSAPDRAEALKAEADDLEARAQQDGSYAGRVGRAIAPVFKPLGFDWQLTDGVLTSFVAREVFVSTMSVLAGSGRRSVKDEGVITRIQVMKRDDGSPVFTPATATSALVFFVLAMQCLATLTVTRKETGGVKYAALQLVYMSVLAYVTAGSVYQVLRAMGVS